MVKENSLSSIKDSTEVDEKKNEKKYFLERREAELIREHSPMSSAGSTCPPFEIPAILWNS